MRYIAKHQKVTNFSYSFFISKMAIVCIFVLLSSYFINGILSYFTAQMTMVNKFTIARSYTVRFDANRGTGTGTGIMQDQEMYENMDAQLAENTFTNVGLNFAGWNTEPDGSGIRYADGQTVRNLTQQDVITLYAQWAEGLYTVIFNANNGAEDKSSQDFVMNVPQNLNENEFEKTGYTFEEWNTEPDGSGTSYADEEEVTNLTDVDGGEVNLYAQWTPNTYEIVFDANGGTGTMQPQEFTYDTAQNLRTNAYTKADYSFWYWNTEPDGTGISYEDEEEVLNLTAVDGDSITLYAIYTLDRYVYKGDYVFGGSNYVNTGIPLFSERNINKNFEVSFEIKERNTSTEKDTMMSVMDESGSPWPGIVYKIYNGSRDQYEANVTTGNTQKVSTKLARDSVSKVTFKRINGMLYININDTGDTAILDMSSMSRTFDVPVTFGASLKSGSPWRYFKGTLSNLNVLVTDAGGMINFDANGGTGTMANQVILSNAQTKLNKNTYTKSGYYLSGWNTEPDGSGTSYSDEGLISIAASQGQTLTLYAQWDKYEYTIRYDANGGTGTMADQVCESANTYHLTPNAFTRNGNTFIKWNTKQDGTGTDYNDGDEITDLGTHDGEIITLYAFWSNRYEYYGDVVFDGNTYINTGIELFNSENLNKDFEIAFEIKNITYKNKLDTLVAAMDESGEPYPGIAYRANGNNTFQLIVNESTSKKKTQQYYPEDKIIKIKRINGVIYANVNNEGDELILDMSSRTDTFDASVIIGAILNASGNPDRYITGTLSNISVIVDGNVGTIRYDANGGTGTMADQVVYRDGPEFIKSNEFRYTGYLFKGWNTAADGTGTSYSNGDTIQLMASQREIKTLYAQWEPYEYVIRYNANGGTGTMADQELESGTYENLTANAFTRSGNTFIKWNTKQDGTGTDYLDEENVVDLGEYDGHIVTLYAMWSNIFEYNNDVVFDGKSTYINTGIPLFSTENASKDFEISFEIIERGTSTKYATLVSAMDESGQPYPGITYRIISSTEDELSANNLTQNQATRYNRADVSKLTLKRIDGIFYININDQGDTQVTDMSTLYRNFDAPVLFGTSFNTEGNINTQRFFKGTLSNIRVVLYDE